MCSHRLIFLNVWSLVVKLFGRVRLEGVALLEEIYHCCAGGWI